MWKSSDWIWVNLESRTVNFGWNINLFFGDLKKIIEIIDINYWIILGLNLIFSIYDKANPIPTQTDPINKLEHKSTSTIELRHNAVSNIPFEQKIESSFNYFTCSITGIIINFFL